MVSKLRQSCFHLAVIVVQSVLFLIDGQPTSTECGTGEAEIAAVVELQRVLLTEVRNLRNSKISIQLENSSNRVEPAVINDSYLQSVDRRLDTLDHLVKTQSHTLITKLNDLDQYTRNKMESLEDLRRNIGGNNESYDLEAERFKLSALPQDCADIRAEGQNKSGVYRIYPIHPGNFAKRVEAEVYCDMDTLGNGWLVFQRRKDGRLNFERAWNEYANGFGNLEKEFWLGNDLLYILTSHRNYELHIDLEDFSGQMRYANYGTFAIGSPADKYRLSAFAYSGDAGDNLSYHSGMQFSTIDSDNDKSKDNCAQARHGAWWYNDCTESNLNGRYLRGNHSTYANGVNWYKFRGPNHSLKATQMKIAPGVS